MKVSKLMLVFILAICGISFWSCEEDLVDPQSIIFKGVEVVAKGNANIEISDGVLLASNLGTSEEDAISYNFPDNSADTTEWMVNFLDPNLSDDLSDGTKRFELFKDDENNLLGKRWVEKDGNFRIIGFDYSSIGSKGTDIELYRDGEVVERIIGYGNNSIRIGNPDFGVNWRICVEVCCTTRWFTWCAKGCTGSSFMVSVPGIGSYEGIDGYKIIPNISDDRTFIPATVEISTKEIETIRISDISFQ